MHLISQLTDKETKQIEKIIAQISAKYSSSLEYDECKQEGYLLLLQLLNNGTYDKEKSKFHTYFANCFRNRLWQLSYNNTSLFTIQPHTIKLWLKISYLLSKGYSEDDIVEDLGISYSLLQNINRLNSLETLNEDIVQNQEIVNISEEIDYIYSLLKDEQQREMFRLCLEGLSLKEIAKIYNKSNEWARLKIKDLYFEIRRLYESRTID